MQLNLNTVSISKPIIYCVHLSVYSLVLTTPFLQFQGMKKVLLFFYIENLIFSLHVYIQFVHLSHCNTAHATLTTLYGYQYLFILVIKI